MGRRRNSRGNGSRQSRDRSARARLSHRARIRTSRPALAYRRRGRHSRDSQSFYAQEDWHEPTGAEGFTFIRQEPGSGYLHPVTLDEIDERLAQLPSRYLANVEVVQLSRMTRKRALFPCYGMQWGPSVYLYPIEDSLVETYTRPPLPQQSIEAKMYGGKWIQDGDLWRLEWTLPALKDFYLNNVLIHEVGHVNDTRNTSFEARERYANWFAIEYGFRASRGRR